MTIYKIIEDTNNVQLIQPCDFSMITIDRFTFDCEPRSHNLEDLLYYVYNPKTKPKNFYSFDSGVLCFDKHVLNLCEHIFEIAGEIIPIRVERQEDLYILNILDCMNCLDYENTIWDYYKDGGKSRILKFAMYQQRAMNESSLFKIPEVSSKEIFCYADTKSEDDEFYHIYKKNNLTGLFFEKIKSR